MKRLICACIAVVLMLSMAALADGYVPAKKLKPSEELYCLDNAGVLSEDTRGEIVYSNDLLSAECGAQIVVVTLDTTGSDAIDDYANELFNTWGIGDAKKGNGFLLLLAIEDDDYYALCGDGLQPKFTSGAIKNYYDRYLEADFAAKRYDAGVKKFFEAVFERVADTYNADVTVAQGVANYRAAGNTALPGGARFGGGVRDGRESSGEDGSVIVMALGVMVVVALFMILMRLLRRRRFHRSVIIPPPPPDIGPGGYRGMDDMPGAGGYRGVDAQPGAGGYRGPTRVQPRSNGEDMLMRGLLYSLFRSMGSSSHSSGGHFRSSGGSRSSGGFRSSGSSHHSSGSSRSFGGGHSSGGGAGRGRH